MKNKIYAGLCIAGAIMLMSYGVMHFRTIQLSPENTPTVKQTQSIPTLYGNATWYSRNECCTKSNPNALMANNKPLDDNDLTCAIWLFKFGTKLKITCGDKSVVCIVTDRGPGRKEKYEDRIIDLSKAAFKRIGDLKSGKIRVRVTLAKEGDND